MDSRQGSLQDKTARQNRETVYLLEDKDGFMVRVPESKLEAWEKAQREPSRPLNRAEQQLIDRIVESVYGTQK